MKSSIVIYWSLTGNTELMAHAIGEGIQSDGHTTRVERVEYVDHTEALDYDVIFLGCPAMTTDILEEQEFKPFFDFIRPFLENRPIALFGSYDWSNEYMERWENMVIERGGKLIGGHGLTVQGTPDEFELEHCRQFARDVMKEVEKNA